MSTRICNRSSKAGKAKSSQNARSGAAAVLRLSAGVADLQGGRYASTGALRGHSRRTADPRPLVRVGVNDEDLHPTEIDKLTDIDTAAWRSASSMTASPLLTSALATIPAKSRVMAIWLQDIDAGKDGPTDKKGRADQGITFGSRLGNKQINALLAKHESEADIYREAGADRLRQEHIQSAGPARDARDPRARCGRRLRSFAVVRNAPADPGRSASVDCDARYLGRDDGKLRAAGGPADHAVGREARIECSAGDQFQLRLVGRPEGRHASTRSSH